MLNRIKIGQDHPPFYMCDWLQHWKA